MMMLPDPIERGEAFAEKCMDEMERGVPLGSLRCLCGRVALLDEFEAISPDPYARPYCRECVAAYMEGAWRSR